jgi:2-oxoglutarate ferredoxin oxidoreductase subunit gamma
MRKEIVIVGSGGQGVQTLGRLLALVLNKKGYLSSFKANYGPEARGGNSSAQVVIRESSSDWPEILNVDLLVAMSQEGYDTWLAKIEPQAIVVFDNYLVRKFSSDRAQQHAIPATKIADELGVPLAANMVMLGAVASISGLVNVPDILEVMPQRAGRAEGNLKALEAGFKLGTTNPAQASKK